MGADTTTTRPPIARPPTEHPFRFGVVTGPRDGRRDWLRTAQRVSDLGCSTLLVPDGPQLLAPFPSLAVAAGVPGLRVGTVVPAGPLRPPRSTAWEAHSLTVLTDGRFEFGIGTGRPAVREFAADLGLPYGSAAERLAGVGESIDRLRELDDAVHRSGRRRRATLGVSYVCGNSAFLEELAPVVERPTGR